MNFLTICSFSAFILSLIFTDDVSITIRIVAVIFLSSFWNSFKKRHPFILGILISNNIKSTLLVFAARNSNAFLPSSRSVFELMQPIIGELFHEEFWVIYLNSSNKVLKKSFLSKGGITSTSVDLRLILKSALQLGAVGLVLTHNHPSGTLKPSDADRNITKKIKEAAELLDLKVVDHLIITENSYFSFADKSLL